MDRTEALTAVLNAARALKQAYPLDLAQQTITNAWMAGCLAQLYSAVAAVDAVGEATWGEGVVEPAPVVRAADPRIVAEPGMCTADPDCWRASVVHGGPCYAHSQWATAERVRDVEKLA